jgi:glycosyltransferase involved in cell wall biosynthesis
MTPPTPIRVLAFIEAASVTGPGKNLLQFAQDARNLPVPVELQAAVFQRGGGANAFLEAARAAGLTGHMVEERGPLDRAGLQAMRDLVERVRPDVVQSHAMKGHFWMRASGLYKTKPWVAFHHGYTWPTWRVRLYNQADYWSLRAAHRVVTVTGAFRPELLARGVRADRLEILPNAIPPGWGQAGGQADGQGSAVAAGLREKWKIGPEVPVVLIVGRLSREKDHISLLEAFARLDVPAHLVVVGEGPERPVIESAIARLRLTGRVTLTGQQPTAEPFYAMARVAVLSSRTEGSPNALLEAMAAGVPAVATAVGGVPETARHGVEAALVPPGDAAAMERELRKLLTDEDWARRLRENALALIERQYHPLARAERLAGIYQRVVEEFPPR